MDTTAALVISEIMFDPAGVDSKREWIEVFNAGSESVTIASIRFVEGGVAHRVSPYGNAAAVIGSGERVVIADDPASFLVDNPNFSGTLLDSAFSLSNTGEPLSLTVSGIEVDEVAYSPEFGAAGTGAALSRDGSQWYPAQPTPGEPNAAERWDGDVTNDDVGSSAEEQSSSVSGVSSHSGPEPLSSLVPKAVFEVDAGRNRAVSVNVPVMFEAVARGAAEGFGARWSFGDGTFARGRSAEHVYDYAGSFVVLLRATRRGDGVVSYDRLSLTTFVPRVSVVSEGSRAWLRNDSGRELNLDGFSYRAGRHRVRFEGDVVVPAGERVPLAEGASPCALEILYPNGAPLLPNACEGGVQSVHDG